MKTNFEFVASMFLQGKLIVLVGLCEGLGHLLLKLELLHVKGRKKKNMMVNDGDGYILIYYFLRGTCWGYEIFTLLRLII